MCCREGAVQNVIYLGMSMVTTLTPDTAEAMSGSPPLHSGDRHGDSREIEVFCSRYSAGHHNLAISTAGGDKR